MELGSFGSSGVAGACVHPDAAGSLAVDLDASSASTVELDGAGSVDVELDATSSAGTPAGNLRFDARVAISVNSPQEEEEKT